MKCSAAVIAALAGISLLATDALPQETPNFAGEWTLSEGTPPQGGRGGRGFFGGLGREAVIVQDENTLTITRSAPGGGEVSSMYNLDGSSTTKHAECPWQHHRAGIRSHVGG